MGIRKNIKFENSYQFLLKWKELLSKGDPPFDIEFEDIILEGCTIICESNGYTIYYDNRREKC